ncbi:hypothetical protein Lser_V15G26154 [Lactuca serriola]
MVVANNNGKPYTDEIFSELKKATTRLHEQTEETAELTEQMHKSYEEQLKRITEMVELKLSETTITLEQQLEEERIQGLKAEFFRYLMLLK